MIRMAILSLTVLAALVGFGRAADKEVSGTLVKVDVKNSTLTVKTADGDKTFDVNADTKFVGPKGGVSDAGLKDDRLVKGVELTLVIAGNNKTAREVRLPERKKAKDK
jgi:hypothetical protein